MRGLIRVVHFALLAPLGGCGGAVVGPGSAVSVTPVAASTPAPAGHSERAQVCPLAPGTKSAYWSDRKLAHAVVKDDLVARKREFIQFGRVFTPESERISEEEQEARLAAVVAEEARGDGTKSDDVTAYELPTGEPLLFFRGVTPTDAGGIGDSNTWGMAVVRVGCTWTRLEGAFGGTALAVYRTPGGAAVLVQTSTSGQCDTATEVRVLHGTNVEKSTISGSRTDMADVCGGEPRVVEPVADGDVLHGMTVTTNGPDGKPTETERYTFDPKNPSKLVQVH